MGQSLSAKVFYGYTWNDEESPWSINWDAADGDHEEGEDEWDDRLMTRYAAAHPEEGFRWPFDKKGNWVGGSEDAGTNRADYNRWNTKRCELKQGFGVDIGFFGVGDYTQNYAYVEGTETRFGWSGVLDFEAIPRSLPEDAEERLTRWVEATGARTDNAEGPDWFVVALYW